MPSPRYSREIPQRYRLEATKCDKCGKIFFPPRLVCSECSGRDFSPTKLKESGTIATYTVIHVGPDQFAVETPYVVGIVELDDGVKITSQIIDCSSDEVEIGKKVEIVFRKIQEEGDHGLICYGYKCRLVR